MSDPREALFALVDATLRPFQVDPKRGPSDAVGAIADAILAAGWTPRGEGDLWEYGVRWGDDGTVTNCGSRERAESRAAESHGDKIVRRTPARMIPAGPWEEMPDE